MIGFKKNRVALLVSFFVLAPVPVFAQITGILDTKLDTSKKIDITSDTLNVRPEERIALFKKDVKAVQGTLNIEAQQMKVFYHDDAGKKRTGNSFSKIETEGEVVLTVPGKKAKSDIGIYHLDKNFVMLVGNVLLKDERGEVAGERFFYDTVKGTSQMYGTILEEEEEVKEAKEIKPKKPGRVRGLFIPKKKISVPDDSSLMPERKQ